MTLERSYELADRTEQQQRIVIIGDGDFLSNTYVGNSGNMELGMRLMNWLSADDDLITIPARTIDDKELNMSELSVGAFGIFFLMLLPLSLLFTAFTIWNRRRKNNLRAKQASLKSASGVCHRPALSATTEHEPISGQQSGSLSQQNRTRLHSGYSCKKSDRGLDKNNKVRK